MPLRLTHSGPVASLIRVQMLLEKQACALGIVCLNEVLFLLLVCSLWKFFWIRVGRMVLALRCPAQNRFGIYIAFRANPWLSLALTPWIFCSSFPEMGRLDKLSMRDFATRPFWQIFDDTSCQNYPFWHSSAEMIIVSPHLALGVKKIRDQK